MLLTGTGASGKAQALIDPAASLITRAGVERLASTPLIANSLEPTTSLRFLGGDAAASGWPERSQAVRLAASGAAPTYGVDSPFPGEKCIKLNGGNGMVGAIAAANPGTQDIWFEVVFDAPLARGCLASKKLSANEDDGFFCDSYEPGLGVLYRLHGNAGTTVLLGLGVTIATAGLRYISCAFNRDENGDTGSQMFFNGALLASANPFALSGVNVTNAEDLKIGVLDASTIPYTGNVHYVGINYRQDWFAAGSQAEWLTLHKQRFNLLLGLDAGYAGTAYPVSF